ncbi:hypothetical protein BB559_004554 [Furculomyces boomerangus]|uniref:U2 small nuclear ribonucleoprotein A' n=1 Tax=Furculomyces boomerangus TaxID=61424 RepID=A0A2T9YE40_9FUNG|nr:hypothetical protein BB559_004554 [Furculomyces boomerangus]
MKLTADLILQSPTHINASKEHEIDLRENRIPMIENLGATKDLYDAIDLTDNEIMVLGNFPLLKRLKCLFLGNNRIRQISDNIEDTLPNIHTIVLTNNYIEELVDLEPLRNLKNLEHLVLINNPVFRKQDFRTWLIYRIPQLRVLNFQKIKLAERKHAQSLYENNDGTLSLAAQNILKVAPSNVFEPGEGLTENQDSTMNTSTNNQEEINQDLAINPEADQVLQNALQAMQNVQTHALESVVRTGKMSIQNSVSRNT